MPVSDSFTVRLLCSEHCVWKLDFKQGASARHALSGRLWYELKANNQLH